MWCGDEIYIEKSFQWYKSKRETLYRRMVGVCLMSAVEYVVLGKCAYIQVIAEYIKYARRDMQSTGTEMWIVDHSVIIEMLIKCCGTC